MANDKYTIIIVDDIVETRENLTKLLKFESDIEVLGSARTGREGIQLAVELKPDVVLMDINMPDIDGIKATELIQEKLPHIQIVILSVQGDANYMRRAMLAGARDFLTKPPKSDELVSAIRRAGAKAQAEKKKMTATAATQMGRGRPGGPGALPDTQGKIICVYSPKGGVGNTSVASNLAVALQNEETPVAIVDADLQFGNVDVFFNERTRNSSADLAPRASELDPEIVYEVMAHHNGSGVDILAAPTHPEDAETVTGRQFRELLTYLKNLYSYIIVDTASDLSNITLETIEVSDVLVLITTQEIPAINNMRIMLGLLDAIGVSRERLFMIMNRYEKQISITSDKVGENLRQEIILTIPEDRRIVVPSVNRGVPFMMDRKKAKEVGEGILSMTEKIRERLVALSAEQVEE
jgi:pilus assembly protein CpaE